MCRTKIVMEVIFVVRHAEKVGKADLVGKGSIPSLSIFVRL